jgi:hypothetical protein
MKRTTSWLVVTLFTFILGVATALLWLEFSRPAVQKFEAAPCSSISVPERASADLPIIAYCELANNPDKYNGKVVRVSARLSGFIHGILFYDQNCASANNGTAVAFHPSVVEEIRRTLTEAADSDAYGFVPLNLIVVGKFEKVTPSHESDLFWDTASQHFEIMRVEKASKAR